MPRGVLAATSPEARAVMPRLTIGRGVLGVSAWSRELGAGEEAGFATLVLDAAPIGYAHLIDRISIQTTSTQATSATLYIGSTASTPMDYSESANLDFSEYARPLLVPGGEQMLIVFQSLSAGSSASARVQGWTVASAELPAVAGLP